MAHKLMKLLCRAMAAFMLTALIASSLPESVSPVHAAAGDITRVSVSSSEAQANAYSRDADVSADGRFVVFWSGASNLVAGDTNDSEEIFLRDLQTGETTRVSVSSSGAQADNGSFYPAISGDGRFIAFMSDATNLVSGDTNGFSDIFLRDRQNGTTTRVSVGTGGAQADNVSDSYVSISGDGRFITFSSDAANLVSGDTNSFSDVFVYDRQLGTTERISLDSNEVQANASSINPSISADGRFVTFSSSATNLVSGDTNGKADVFVRDRTMGVTTRVSVNSSGVEADRGGHDPSISGDGRYVTFSSVATNLLLFGEEPYGYDHVYMHDRQTGATTLVSTQDGYQMVGTSTMPDISSDGRYIAFEFEDRGDGIAFVAIYIHDRLTGLTTRVSGPGGGSEDSSFGPAISANGNYVAFSSFNSRLVPDDTNEWNDIFLLELAIVTPTTKTYQSIGTYDGWVIETGEDNETGIRIDERASTFFLGDAANDQQYRSILHFGTSSLPNDAIITKVTLKIKRQGIVGDNPFTTHGGLLVDVRKPFFGTDVQLEVSDFQAAADLSAIGTLENLPGGLWYTATLDATAFPYINLTGTTQFRLRFALDDNDDREQDYMKFFSGDAAADQPVLTIDYFQNSAGQPLVDEILRVDPNPTSASSVRFTVAFSEPVTGVDVTDFTLATTGGISSASVNGVSGSGDTYTVTVGTGTGSGTIGLNVPVTATITDLAGNALGSLPFTGGESYTIERTPTVPGATTLISPTGNIGTNYTPAYTWNKVSGASWYYLWIDGPSGNIFKEWYETSAICSGGSCSVTPAGLVLGGGNYTWWVQTWNDGGYGPWSDGMSFTLTAPALPGNATLVSPNGSIGTNDPTYTWNEVSGASWYYLWVDGPTDHIFHKWYSSADANCNGATCSVAGATPNLRGGSYTWYVQTWNDGGYGPWSNGMTFTSPTPTPPGKATLTNPSGSILNNNPAYTWNEVSGAAYYYLWVDGPSGHVFDGWYTTTQASCNGLTCSVADVIPNLGAGTHTWWIQTWNNAGYGPWSDGKTFTVSPPGVSALVSPNGSVANNPTYTWNEVPGATYYYLWINGSSGNVFQQWYTSAQTNCNGSTCSVANATPNLSGGSYTWWIQTWSNVGYGPWSTGLNFTVSP